MTRTWFTSAMTVVWAVAGTAAYGDITVPGADGSDGVFNPTSNIEVDLSQAATRQWDQPSPVAGKGVYDPNKWAVIFKYSSVNIPSGVTVTFKNHASRAPVVWLVSGDVTVAGTLSLNGGAGYNYGGPVSHAEPGPGGFRGGVGGDFNRPNSGGMGPGGSSSQAASSGNSPGGSYASTGGAGGGLYGHPALRALIGGSGAAGPLFSFGGGAGGGAILIASAKTISLQGLVSANGGAGPCTDAYGACWQSAGGGSGGAIRLVADTVTGGGALRAVGGPSEFHPGGAGRIRVERNSGTINDPGAPGFTEGSPGETATIWPETTAPSIRVTVIGDQNVPADPRASFDFPGQDTSLTDPSSITIRLECRNTPPDWNVKVRVVPKTGADFAVDAVLVSGDLSASVWEASLSLPDGFCAIQARASKP
ncbi:MAG TPA: hypothetical protein PKY77_06505 [Phycisphaerae bacterium]|nr:hypothetical protein [Phycisphaerae bacterium]HRY69492.1 hypothetical protein [Phycisphaerae bacterium]HSA29094.1 hypothetical protein [Phycisphaerae bacterium]